MNTLINPDVILGNALEPFEKATLYPLHSHHLPHRPHQDKLVIVFASSAIFRRQWVAFFPPDSMMSSKAVACTALRSQMVLRMKCAGAILAPTKSLGPYLSSTIRSTPTAIDVLNADTMRLHLHLLWKVLTTKPSRRITGS